MFSIARALISSMILVAVGHATPNEQQRQQQRTNSALQSVHNFPNNTWIENMAIRSNGQILGTSLYSGQVYLVDPLRSPNVTPPVVGFFGKEMAMAGTTEVEDDIFYVLGTNNSANALQSPANSSTVWRIDMRPYARTGPASVSKVADVPQILGPNGMTLLSKSEGTVLIADPSLGLIWRYCVHNGQYEIVNDDSALKPDPKSFLPFGVNGLKVIGSTLYFTNTNKGYLGTFQISRDGRARSSPRLITSNVPNADDFAVGTDGSVWLTQNVPNKVVCVFPNGNIVVVAEGDRTPALSQPVSARFGRTQKDKNTLYISTAGALGFSDDGVPFTTDGKILAIDTCR